MHMSVTLDRSGQIDNASVPIKTADEREGFLVHLRNMHLGQCNASTLKYSLAAWCTLYINCVEK